MRRRDFLTTAATVSVAATAFSNSVFHATETVAIPVEKNRCDYVSKNDGTFKIAQFTDTHYHISSKMIAIESVRLIEKTLDAEKPQLVVYTGDIVANKMKFVGNITRGWDDILAPCIEREIPYVVVFGNYEHDHSEMSRCEIVHYIAQKPYS
jgi:predicted MPP superfamily phosphohydrolase